jgi:methyl-accepting chemotaxis protein
MKARIFLPLSCVIIIAAILSAVYLRQSAAWLLAAISIALVAYSMILTNRQVLKPLQELTGIMQDIARGRFDVVIKTDGAGGMHDLQQAAAEMLHMVKEKTGTTDAILTNIITPMTIVDAKGNITWLNESMLKLTEQQGRPEDFHGQSLSVFFYGDNRETVTSKALLEKKKQFAKTQMQSHKGNTKYISVASAPIIDNRGTVFGAFTSVMDFTNIKLKEDHIIAQNERIASGARHALEVAEQVSGAAQELSNQVMQSNSGADTQRARTAEVATAVEEMNATILEVARNAGAAAETAAKAQQTARDGVGVVKDVIEVMDRVNHQAGTLKTAMNGLGTQAEGIGRIIAVINDIADQTNLLALNAAIEAARAGDAGRGFAVVADEVRKLAEKTMTATKEVGSHIKAIQESARGNMAATEETTAVIGQAAALAHTAGGSLDTILHLVETTSDQVRAIATAAEEQSAASEEINRSTDEISRIADETARAMEHSSATVAELTRLAAELRGSMEKMLEK